MDTKTHDLMQNTPRCVALDRAIGARDSITRDLPVTESADALVKAAAKFLTFLTGEEPMVRNDDGTMFKVYSALRGQGLTEQQTTDAISEMQNGGILFRERVPSE